MKLATLPSLVQKPSTSGASRKKSILSFSKSVFFKFKKLSSYKPWSSGRNSSGRIVTLSKGRRTLKSRTPILNKSYRDTSVSFIGGFSLNPYSNTLYSTVFSGSGSISVVPASDLHKLLALTSFRSLFFKRSQRMESLLAINKILDIKQSFYLVVQLPRHAPVSHLETQPGKGISIACSPGSSAKILKIDPRTSLSLIRLPSGVRKVISIFSIGSLGKSALPLSKKINVTSASINLKSGQAPRSRGVAKNPVDHPHGGRTKAIKYPRTPWGLTTKFK